MKSKANGTSIAALGAIVGCFALCLAALSVPSARADDVNWAQKNADACNNALGYNACANLGRPSAPAPSITFGVDPCFIAQNAMRPCNSSPQALARPIGVDAHLLGTWYLPIGKGIWVFEILPNGSYKFHSEAGDGVAPHTGSFSANNGHWSMRATTGYVDGGTYLFQAPDIWIATGRLGTGAWRQNLQNVVLRR
jgi:hypothetical protein